MKSPAQRFAAYFFSCLAAAAFICLSAFPLHDFTWEEVGLYTFLSTALFLFSYVFLYVPIVTLFVLFLAAPGALAILGLAHILRIKHFAYFLVAGLFNGIGCFLLVTNEHDVLDAIQSSEALLIATGGLIGGYVYWRIAIRGRI